MLLQIYKNNSYFILFYDIYTALNDIFSIIDVVHSHKDNLSFSDVKPRLGYIQIAKSKRCSAVYLFVCIYNYIIFKNILLKGVIFI